MAGAFFADLFPTLGLGLDFRWFDHDLLRLQLVFDQHPSNRMCSAVASSRRGFGLWQWQRDDIGQTLQQQFQLVFVQTFIAPTTEVMADILIEFLTQQPVLQFQRDDTRTQLIYLLKQRGVGVHQKYFSGDTNSFLT